MESIIKPYEWTGTINNETEELSKICWNKVWEFINKLPIDEEIKDYKGKILHNFMNYLEEKYPYKDEISETIFDCVSQDEFEMYLRDKYNIKTYTETIENIYITIK